MRRFLFAAAIAAAIPASGSSTSALTGRVTIDGAPGDAVSVTATSSVLTGPRTTTTTQSGMYWLESLPPGTYDVTFTRSGATTLTRRAVIELARTGRADAELETSEDEETVTSTARTISAAETTAITTHLSDAMLERLPVRRHPREAASVAPGGPSVESLPLVDGGLLVEPSLVGEEIIDQVTIIRGAVPVEYGRAGTSAIVAATRPLERPLSLTLRDTLTTDGGGHLFEAAAGGGLLSDRLRIFAAAWGGERPGIRRLSGLDIQLAAQLGARQNLAATYIDADGRTGGTDAATMLQSFRYTATVGSRVSANAVASRSHGTSDAGVVREDRLKTSVAYHVGSHVIDAGADAWNGILDDEMSLFVNDRWSRRRWTLDAGMRHEIGDFEGNPLPRVALLYAFGGEIPTALHATYGHYEPVPGGGDRPIRLASLGYVAAFGVSGAARIDLMRRDEGDAAADIIELDGRYRLFDRFELGGNYTFVSNEGTTLPEQTANGWLAVDLPIGEHEAGVTVLQRYVDGFARTDLSLRYTMPLSRLVFTIASDVIDVFAAERSVRIRVRVRL